MEETSKYKIGSDKYLIQQTDLIIGKLVQEKTHLFKAYNYYQGFRDKYQFKHLEENYGVGNPTSIKFTPLVRKHIDAIVGEYLTTKIQPKISCKDKKTLTNIMRDKQTALQEKQIQWLTNFIDNTVYKALQGQQSEPIKDSVIEAELQEIEDSVNREFISNYEMAAQTIVQYVLNSRSIDFKNKLAQLLLDLLVAGEAYYKVVRTPSGHNFQIEVESPLNVFPFKHADSRYMKDCSKCVVRHWLTKEEIAIKYGRDLSEDDFKSLDDQHIEDLGDSDLVWIAAVNSRGCPRTSGILAGTEVGVMPSDYNIPYELIPVYDVEWIDYNKSKERGIAYHVTRIGSDIYILDGENEDTVRSSDSPTEARVSLNGLHYTNRGLPYSMMLATVDLQDVYDLLLYQKDNLIALSGTKSANVDVAHLPEFLGENMKERILKYQAYRKMGLAMFDSSQEGEVINTAFTNNDDSVSLPAIQAIQLGIEIIENTVSSITGVFRERLNGIQPRDAVANVEAGMEQSYIITKQYHQAMETLVSEILVDCINLAKKVYKHGQTGQVVLGNQNQIFTLLPENFAFTDYDIHLADSQEIVKEQDKIQQYALELTKGNMVDPVDFVNIASSKSLTEMRELIYKSAAQKKKENNQLQQMAQQLEQAQNQVKQMQQQLEQTTRKLATLNEQKLVIERADNETKNQIQWYKVKSDAENKEKELDLIKQRNQLEGMQIVADDGKQNDEVLNRKY